MIFLLDVNALLALGLLNHDFHDRVTFWVSRLAEKGIPNLGTCPTTELGFVRVLSQAQQYNFTLDQARDLLLDLKASPSIRCTFIPDGHDISHLPKWAEAQNR